jgi:ribosomal protein L11 methyltransferase
VHGHHDRAKVPTNKLGIEIEAALAFGTGHHGTTRGCLLLLDHVLKGYRPRRVLDLGTGTGVLAIAAAGALQVKVMASDIDPLAVRVARGNARLNGTANLVATIRATGFSAPQFAQHPLRQMATPMARHLAPSALVILSGLLPHQAQSVIAAYRGRGLVLERQLQIEGWSSLLMRYAR